MGNEIVVWLWLSLGIWDSRHELVMVREGPYTSVELCRKVGDKWLDKVVKDWPDASTWCTWIGEESNEDHSDSIERHNPARDSRDSRVDL